MQYEHVHVTAPFDMPPLKIPNFNKAAVFNILDFGAKEDNQQQNNIAIAKAISQASALGGGRVLIPQGQWRCAKIHLQSYVELHLSKGAVLLFSPHPEDYLPAVQTSWEGMECYNYSPLIYAFACSHIAITGQGKLQACMDIWNTWSDRPTPHMQALAKLYHQAATNVPVEQRNMVFKGANLRPHFIQFNRCQHILLEEFTIENSPFWVIHPLLCEQVLIRNISVKALGHNCDGVDPEMTQNMLIEHCTFEQGDDALAIKAGRNHDGWRLNVPCKNIVMRHCQIKRAHLLMAIGSELSAGVENVLVDDCQFDGLTDYHEAGNLLLIKTNERRGGFVRNIYMNNISANHLAGALVCIETDVLYQWRDLVPTYEIRFTTIQDIFLTNIQAKSAKHLSRIQGQAKAPIKNVQLSNIQVTNVTTQALQNTHVEEFIFNQ